MNVYAAVYSRQSTLETLASCSLVKAQNEWKPFIFFLCNLSKWQLLILHHFSAKSLSRWQKIVVCGEFLHVVWEKVSLVQMMLLTSMELLLFYFIRSSWFSSVTLIRETPVLSTCHSDSRSSKDWSAHCSKRSHSHTMSPEISMPIKCR